MSKRRITPEIVLASSGSRARSTIVPYHPPRLRSEVGAILLILVSIFLLRASAIREIGSKYLGGFFGDAGLYPWLVRSNAADLFSAPWFSTRAFYPYAQTLAWSDNFILPSLIATTLMQFGFTLIVAYNLVLLGASFLNGYSTYRAVYALTGNSAASLFSGIGFLSFGYLTLHLGHPQLQFAFFIPLALSFTVHFFGTRSFLPAFFVGLTGTLALLTSVYYAVFAGLGVFALLLALVLLRPAALRFFDYLKFGIGALAGLAFSFEFVHPYLNVAETFGSRNLYEANAFSATALSYISAPYHSMLYSFTSSWANPEAQLFPGIIVLVLALAAYRYLIGTKKLALIAQLFLGSLTALAVFSVIDATSPSDALRMGAVGMLYLAFFSLSWLLFRLGKLERGLHFHILTNRSLVAAALFVAFLFFAFSLGPLGDPEKKQSAFGIFRIFYELFPGGDGIRAVSRAGVGVVLMLFIAVGVALPSLVKRFKLPAWVPLMLTVLVVVENVQNLLVTEAPEAAPEIFSRLSPSSDLSSAAIVLPYARALDEKLEIKSWSDFARINVNSMHWAFESGVPILNGYSGVKTKIMREFPRELRGFPDERSFAALASVAGLNQIIVLPALIENFDAVAFKEKMSRFKDELRIVDTDSAGNMLLSFSGKTRVTERNAFFLRAPTTQRGMLVFEATALLNKKKPVTSLNLYLDPHAMDRPFATLELKCDGNWNEFTVALPQTPDTVRPLAIRFERETGDNVFFRNTRFRKEG